MHSVPAARDAGIPQTQSSTNAVRGFKSTSSLDESNPEPVPYSIAKRKMGSGPRAESPRNSTAVSAPATVRNSVRNRRTAPAASCTENRLCQQFR